MYEKELLEEFVEWAKNCGEDVFYIFEETDKAIQIFLDQKEE
jgi:peptide subunit release factor 1 (eRF1)